MTTVTRYDSGLGAERAQLRLRLDRALVGRDAILRRLRVEAKKREQAEMDVWDEDHALLLARLRELDAMLGEER